MSVATTLAGLGPLAAEPLRDGDERIVVAVDPGRARDEDVRAHVESDRARGVRTLVVDAANDLPPTGFALDAAADLREAAARRPAAGERRASEPLAEAAMRARDLAARHCTRCRAYHALVPSLRLLGVLDGPQRHGRFFQESLRDARRVLVAGAADTAMLAQVIEALGGRAGEAEITVLDLCETPVRLSAWYAERHGIAIDEVAADAAEWEGARGLEALVTDSVLTLMAPECRAAAVRRWRAMLAPGGRVVTSMRIATGDPGAGRFPDPDGWAALVAEAAALRRALLPFDAAGLGQAARSYADGIETFPVRSEAELVALFTDAGFTIDSLAVGEHRGRVPDDRAGPGAHRTATFAQVVARA